MILELYAIFYWSMFILGIWKLFELIDKVRRIGFIEDIRIMHDFLGHGWISSFLSCVWVRIKRSNEK